MTAPDLTRGGVRGKPLAILDLFSGIGGFSLGLERAGMHTVAFCEIDPFCRRVLAKHWSDVPCHDDVTTREFQEGEADVICGGFPCQDVSAAGLRAGLAGARSGLYRELVRAFRVVRPKILIVENVARLLSDGLGTVLGDLAESRDCRWIEWDCVPAEAVGAPHQRDRVFIVAHAGCDGQDGAEIGRSSCESEDEGRLFEFEGCFAAPSNAADPASEQVGPSGQPRRHVGMEPSLAAEIADADSFDADGRRHGAGDGLEQDETSLRRGGGTSARMPTDPPRLGRGQRRSRRPPDSFARVRDEARRNATDPYGARLAFREGLTRDAWEKLTSAERDAFGNVGQSIWPDEPALQGVDDGDAYWMDRIAATGNQVLPQIPELIGRAILAFLPRESEAA